MSLFEAAVLFVAAAAAGVVNSIAGGGSLISFPALIWTGLDPIVANATNTVAISPGAIAAMVPFRREIADSRDWLRLLAPPSIVGGALGAVLLLWTPKGVFAEMVPALILFATGVFALQEVLTRRAAADVGEGSLIHPARDPLPTARGLAIAFQLAIAIYGGYFGAGIGILMLASLGFLGLRDLHRAIGMRSFLGACINGIAAAYFVFSGKVEWVSASVMIAGQVAGGYGGAAVARRVPRSWVRAAVVLIGLAMAASLFVAKR